MSRASGCEQEQRSYEIDRGAGGFQRFRQALRFTDLVDRTGLPKATLHRILSTLLEERLLHFDGTSKSYRLGIRLITWAHNTWHGLDIRHIAAEELKHLGELTNETIHLAILDGERTVYVDKHESSQQVRMYSAVGKTGPVHCTGVGKVIAAFLEPTEREALVGQLSFDRYTASTITDPRLFMTELDSIRESGYGRDEREHEDEIRCIAAPVLDHQGRSVASISISAPAYRISDDKIEQWLPQLLESVRKVSENYARILR
ncbi:MAG: IclR family transcriptional regulator [Trueperaceae bacterium]